MNDTRIYPFALTAHQVRLLSQAPRDYYLGAVGHAAYPGRLALWGLLRRWIRR